MAGEGLDDFVMTKCIEKPDNEETVFKNCVTSYMDYPLNQGWATIFVRGPHWAFLCVSRAKFRSFRSNMLFQS